MTTEKNTKSKAAIAVTEILVAAVLWGTIGIFVDKMSSFGLDSMQIVFLRAVTAALGLFLYVLAADRESLRIRLRDVWIFVGTGVVSFVFFNFCYFTCIQIASLPVAAALLYTAPVFVMLLSVLLFHEKMTAQKMTAMLATVCGCILLSGIFSQQKGISAAGLLLGIASGFLYGLYSIFGQIGIRRGYRSMTITVYTFLFAAVSSAVFTDVGATFVSVAGTEGMVWTVLLGVLTCIAPYLLYTAGLTRTEASSAAVIATMEPAVAAVIGFCYFRDEISVPKIAGIVLILSAVILLNLKRKHRRRGGDFLECEEEA